MSLIETAKDVVELVQKADNIDLMRKVLQLQQEAMEQQEAIHRLTEELRDARAKLAQREAMSWDHNVYWRGDGKGREGPFCPKCLDGEERIARMANLEADIYGFVWKCPCCNHQVSMPKGERSS